jgi:hypothetical protein
MLVTGRGQTASPLEVEELLLGEREEVADGEARARCSRRSDAGWPADLRSLVAAARDPVPGHERETVYAAACGIAVLALLDAVEDPARGDATAVAVRRFLGGATPHRLAVLLERIDAREAHGVVHGLSMAGLIEPNVAQIAHARIDVRPIPT